MMNDSTNTSYILGITAFTHDTSASLVKNGELVFFVEEERLNRIKHSSSFPTLAIKECLKFANITVADIDAITFSQIPALEIFENIRHVAKYFPKTLNLFKEGAVGEQDHSFTSNIFSPFIIKTLLQETLNSKKLPRIFFNKHHLSHCSSSFYASPYDEAALLSLDGRGESTTTMMAKGSKNSIEVIHEIKTPHSLGHLYAALTDYLGFKPFHDEWKVMGLSAYGKSTYLDKFSKLVRHTSKGFDLDLSYFNFHTHGRRKWLSEKFYKDFGPKRKSNEEYSQHHKDIAFALQKTVEKTALHLAEILYQIYPNNNLCLSGGVALNCLMNSYLLKNSSFDNIFVQPIANDAGASFGSAWLTDNKKLNNDKKWKSIYLGPKFSNAEIQKNIKEFKLDFKQEEHFIDEAASNLLEGKIIAWFQGRMEAGPRALGNRSLLANPTDINVRDKLNLKVKKREYFRPFAPSVLEEYANDFFHIPKNLHPPYMVFTVKVREDVKHLIPAVVHNDGTARIQIVKHRDNPLYHQLISEFYFKTNIPLLLNTSFNINEPIVCTPSDAIKCFMNSNIDVLFLGNNIIYQ